MIPAEAAVIKPLRFKRLPDYASYLLNERLDDWARTSLDVAREIDVPLLKLLSHLSEDEAQALAKRSAAAFLEYLATDRADEQIQESMARWKNDAIEGLRHNDISSLDISLINEMRRRALHEFLEDYTDDLKEALAIVDEINAYMLASETAATETYIALFKERLQQRESQLLEAQELTLTGSFVWNLQAKRSDVTPQLLKILELGHADDFEGYMQHVHPDDRQRLETAIATSLKTGVYDCEYRYNTRSGEKRIWSRGVVEYTDAVPALMKGTVTDVTERHRLIEQLRESEHLFKRAEALTHIGNWSWDVITNEVTWSEELFRIHGLEPYSVVPSFALELLHIHPDDRELVSNAIADSLKNNKPGEVYYRLLLQDGAEKIIHGKAETQAHENGRVYRMTGTAQDVTEQQLVQKQLRDNQTFIQKVANATPSIIASYNINTGVYSYVSGGLEKLLGYPPQTVLKQGVAFLLGIVHPDDLAQITEKNTAALQRANAEPEQDLVSEFTYRMRHKNGSYRWFHTYGTVFDRNENGLVENVLNISLDITDRVLAERRVVERESFIQHIADASPTVMYLFDLHEARVTYVNSEIQAALGFSPEEIIEMGNLFTPTVYHPEDFSKSPEMYEGYKSKHSMQPIMEYECRMKHKQDGWRWMLVREMIYERNTDGIPTSVLGSALDITDRKRMEETLMRRTGELQQTNANLAEFAYVASHDLKEPLRKIQVFADRIAAKEADRLSETGKDWFGRMKSAATRMDELIDDLLSFSRTNTTEEAKEPVDLNELLTLVKADLSAPMEKSKATILSDTLPTVNGIGIQLRQLFQNLLSNGIKFRKPDVPPIIRITIDTVTGHEISSGLVEKQKHFLKISFADNGIGFEPEYAEKIFGLFQRLHGKSEYPGTGIGLALCRKVVENHNGVIEAQSVPGEGATFNVYLPA